MLKDVGILVPKKHRNKVKVQHACRQGQGIITCNNHNIRNPISLHLKILKGATHVMIVACYHPLPLPACMLHLTLFLCFLALQSLHTSTFYGKCFYTYRIAHIFLLVRLTRSVFGHFVGVCWVTRRELWRCICICICVIRPSQLSCFGSTVSRASGSKRVLWVQILSEAVVLCRGVAHLFAIVCIVLSYLSNHLSGSVIVCDYIYKLVVDTVFFYMQSMDLVIHHMMWKRETN